MEVSAIKKLRLNKGLACFVDKALFPADFSTFGYTGLTFRKIMIIAPVTWNNNRAGFIHLSEIASTEAIVKTKMSADVRPDDRPSHIDASCCPASGLCY